MYSNHMIVLYRNTEQNISTFLDTGVETPSAPVGQQRHSSLSFHITSLYSATAKVLASNYWAVPRSSVSFAFPRLSLSLATRSNLSFIEASQSFIKPQQLRQELIKLAETRQRQSQPNWNKLCGKGCLTATEHCSPNGPNLPTGLPRLIRIYYMRRWKSYSLGLTKEPEFAQRFILYNGKSAIRYDARCRSLHSLDDGQRFKKTSTDASLAGLIYLLGYYHQPIWSPSTMRLQRWQT